MIPKKIHYCWFGGNALGENERKCITSWKKFCPEFEIIEWNESNCDLNVNNFVRQAYELKEYAFVADFFRYYVIYENGGIYLDTDVELIKPLDDLLDNEFYCGIEKNDADNINHISSGIGFGGVKNNSVSKRLIEYYSSNDFTDGNGKPIKKCGPMVETPILIEMGFDENKDCLQKLQEATVYPSEYFAPKSFKTGEIKVTENTYSIHHYAMSWIDKDYQNLKRLEWDLVQKYGKKKASKIIRRKEFFLKIKRRLRRIFQKG